MRPKRTKRRLKREAEFGPEKDIVSTIEGFHTLTCGHTVAIHETERPNIKRRRCMNCHETCAMSEVQ